MVPTCLFCRSERDSYGDTRVRASLFVPFARRIVNAVSSSASKLEAVGDGGLCVDDATVEHGHFPFYDWPCLLVAVQSATMGAGGVPLVGLGRLPVPRFERERLAVPYLGAAISLSFVLTDMQAVPK